MVALKRQTSELEQAIGFHAVSALATAFPNQRIYVPWAKNGAMERFMENFEPIIGADKVAALIASFGGDRIAVPSHTPMKRKKLTVPELQMVSDLTEIEQLNAAQIAKIMRCSTRSVYYARRRARAAGLMKRKRKRKTR